MKLFEAERCRKKLKQHALRNREGNVYIGFGNSVAYLNREKHSEFFQS